MNIPPVLLVGPGVLVFDFEGLPRKNNHHHQYIALFSLFSEEKRAGLDEA